MDIFGYDLSTFNETDVREAIVAPLLACLGYKRGGRHKIRTEVPLTYPKNSLGKKKPLDPPLRGKADYTLEVDGRIRWVLEVKAPGEPLDANVIEQAYSYAVHAEVGAVYYCVTNGRHLKVFRTNQGTHSPPIFECSYVELQDKLPILANVLGPDAVIRANPEYVLDLRPPLGPGLGSLVRIVNGRIVFADNSIDLRPLVGMIMSVSDGSVEHHEAGGMVANLTIVATNQDMQRYNEQLQIDKITLLSSSKCLSTDPESPTEFRSEQRGIALVQGDEVLDMQTWSHVRIPLNVTCNVSTRVVGFVKGRVFTGWFQSIHEVVPPRPFPRKIVQTKGQVTLELA